MQADANDENLPRYLWWRYRAVGGRERHRTVWRIRVLASAPRSTERAPIPHPPPPPPLGETTTPPVAPVAPVADPLADPVDEVPEVGDPVDEVPAVTEKASAETMAEMP